MSCPFRLILANISPEYWGDYSYMVRFKQVTGAESPAWYALLSFTLSETVATQGTIDRNRMIEGQGAMGRTIAISRE